ncbi:hypothetical protein DFH09DRAFT_1324298 [Mycena vulgaris]|nr:hypothetical protein DFH09DRAFT_1324298 [Mycena vulgaris]
MPFSGGYDSLCSRQVSPVVSVFKAPKLPQGLKPSNHLSVKLLKASNPQLVSPSSSPLKSYLLPPSTAHETWFMSRGEPYFGENLRAEVIGERSLSLGSPVDCLRVRAPPVSPLPGSGAEPRQAAATLLPPNLWALSVGTVVLLSGCALWIVVMGDWITTLVRFLRGFIYFHDGMDAVVYFRNKADVTETVGNAFLVSSVVVGDSMIIYRLWVVWSFNRKIIILPILSLLGLFISLVITVQGTVHLESIALDAGLTPITVFTLVCVFHI